MKSTDKQTYEAFHENTNIQKRIVTDNNFTYRIILSVVNKFLISPKSVLDIGCGAGTIALYLGKKGNTVHGIDISEKAVVSANKSAEFMGLKNVSFKKAFFPDEIPKGKYDFIICSEVIEHIKNDDLALQKIYLLLKKGGIAFISTPSINAPMHRMGLAKDFDKRVGHLRRYTLEELSRKCTKVGFSILETKKTEGVLRNFLFLNPIAGKLVRFIKFFIADWVTALDTISLKLFGESNLFIVVKKS